MKRSFVALINATFQWVVDNKLANIYAVILVLSVITLVGGNIALMRQNINESNLEFQRYSHRVHQNLVASFAINETILDGFAAFLAEVGIQDPNRARYYTRLMMNRYPHLYMFQAAQRVPADNISRFQQTFSEKVGESFYIKRFEFGTGLIPAMENGHSEYFPLVFVEPVFKDGFNILGLDISSIQFIHDAMQKARKHGLAALTQPIELAEGQQALVLVKPSYLQHRHIPDQYALLIIELQSFLTEIRPEDAGHHLTLNIENDFNILDIKTDDLSDWEKTLFPVLTFNQDLTVGNDTLKLKIQQQLGFQHVDWVLSIALLVIALFVISFILFLLRRHLHSERKNYEFKQKLYRQANYDTLTGLPNRNHFDDAFTRAMVSALRRQEKIAILYLDLNDFKGVNDTFGHHIGDRMLQIAAGIIQDSIRADDLPCRFGGDEFVIMLENIEYREDVMRVVNLIHEQFSMLTEIEGFKMVMRASIGFALFPDDATSLDHLLIAADERMYEDKRQSKMASKS